MLKIGDSIYVLYKHKFASGNVCSGYFSLRIVLDLTCNSNLFDIRHKRCLSYPFRPNSGSSTRNHHRYWSDWLLNAEFLQTNCDCLYSITVMVNQPCKTAWNHISRTKNGVQHSTIYQMGARNNTRSVWIECRQSQPLCWVVVRWASSDINQW